MPHSLRLSMLSWHELRPTSPLVSGLRLTKLADLAGCAFVHEPDTILPERYAFPRFMLVAFGKPDSTPNLSLSRVLATVHRLTS